MFCFTDNELLCLLFFLYHFFSFLFHCLAEQKTKLVQHIKINNTNTKIKIKTNTNTNIKIKTNIKTKTTRSINGPQTQPE